MTTEVKILANRLNSQKSTGPKTPEGKAVVSQNALKHGLSARRDVIITECQEEYDLHRASLLDELDPQTPMESMLADRIVSLSWRLKRADLIQNQTFDAMHEEKKSNPFPALPKFLTAATENQDPDLILGRIALKDFSNARVLDRLLMYERRIEHSLYKTLLELQRLRLIRNLEPSEPNLEPENRCLAPTHSFSRRRHLSPGDDDALAPNSTPHTKNPTRTGIPIRQDPIINNQSSIENAQTPETAYLAPGPVPGGLMLHAPRNTQNKPNSQSPKISTTSYAANTSANTSPQFDAEKQSQTKPTHPLPPQRTTNNNHPRPARRAKIVTTPMHGPPPRIINPAELPNQRPANRRDY